ncbi:hypothetical protein [Elizabethkingia anophelis]|uniref:hypothetical protein n=1 Tax=Elizabethkingia anophelis TaxID=1117645 RepID=UPI00389192C6
MAVNSELIETIKASQLPRLDNPNTGDIIHAQGDDLSTTSLSYFLSKIDEGAAETILFDTEVPTSGFKRYKVVKSGDYTNVTPNINVTDDDLKYNNVYISVNNGVSLKELNIKNNNGLSNLDNTSITSINSKAVHGISSVSEKLMQPIGVNVFPKDYPFKNEYYVDIDGSLITSPSFNVYKIYTKGNSVLTINISNRIVFFDSNNTFISGENTNPGGVSTHNIPSNSKYVLITVHKDDIQNVQVEFNSSFSGYKNQVFGSDEFFTKSANILDNKSIFQITEGNKGSIYMQKTTEGIGLYVKERITIFTSNKDNSTYFVNPGYINIPNGSYLYLSYNGYHKVSAPNLSVLDMSVVDYSTSKINEYNYIIGILWNDYLYSNHELFNGTVQDLSFSDNDLDLLSNKINVRNQISSFISIWNDNAFELKPLEVLAIGDSITNFQNCTEWKTDKTVEPQGLYGNSFARWLWRRLNYTFTDKETDSANLNNFKDTNPAEWGNMRFLRVDNSNVIKAGEFIPSGTRQSDGSRIWWSEREYIGQSSTCLGAFRGVLDDSDKINTSIGEITMHNQQYFFSDSANASVTFNLPSGSKGFSIVFWGDSDTFKYPKTTGATPSYLSRSVKVEVNGVEIETYNPTTYRGQTRKDFILTGSGDFVVKITNTDSAGRLLNLWGLEYWTGKCVRLVNGGLAGNQAKSFTDNPDFFINKPCDLIVWETTSLNDAEGQSSVKNHVLLGTMLRTLCDQMLIVNSHPVSEDIPSVTNYPERQTGTKVYQHKNAFAANKALSILGLSYVDTFNLFKNEGEKTGFNGMYNRNFVDLTHLSSIGTNKYTSLLDRVLTFK